MIGVFDSGYGGLTILRAIHRALLEYSTMYLGDNAHAPYGVLSDEEILELTRRGVEILFQKGCTLVILGCNTASAAALHKLQQEWLPRAYPNNKILGIIVPTVEAISTTSHKTVGVLATSHTVATGAYETEIHNRNKDIKVVQYACSNLAGIIEKLGVENPRAHKEAKNHVERFLALEPHPDAVLLGCTHYDLIAEYIRTLLPPNTQLIRQPEIVAKSLGEYLVRHPEIESQVEKTGKRVYFTTGNPEEVSKKSSELMGEPTVFTQI